MVRVQYKDDRYAAVLVCDVCEQRIANAGAAVAAYRHGVPGESELIIVLHAHKGKCHDAAEARQGGKDECGWAEMTTHLYQLVLNAQVRPESLAEKRDFEDNVGRL